MATQKQGLTTKQTATDFSLPNTARMYDYYLGGTHNTEADRQAAEAVIASAPFVPFLTRTHRACLIAVAHELTRRGYDLLIDFASGLPTQDHVHQQVPESTVVVYADLDPVVVDYSREILDNMPNVHYFLADMRQPQQLLGQPIVQQLLQEGRKPALITWGIALYLSNEALAALARALYDLTPPETCWAFNATLAEMNRQNAKVQTMLGYYENLNEPLHIRSLETYAHLVQPWQPDAGGFVSIYDWHGIDPASLDADNRDALGPAGGGYGAYLVK